MIRDCKSCGSDYRVPRAEQDWCAAQGISLPRRCQSCRAERRGVENQLLDCSHCGESFNYPREFALLVSVLGLTEPARCPPGCPSDEASSPADTPELRALTELWSDMYDPLPEAQNPTSWKLPAQPDDLFNDNLGQHHDTDTAAESPAVEGLPSPDALFQGLSGPSRKAKG